MPLYKCKGANCAFSTDDLDAYIDHKVDHKIKELQPKREPEAPKPKTHETVEDYLNCPECFPKFEAGFLKRGYAKPPEKKPEEKKKRRLF